MPVAERLVLVHEAHVSVWILLHQLVQVFSRETHAGLTCIPEAANALGAIDGARGSFGDRITLSDDSSRCGRNCRGGLCWGCLHCIFDLILERLASTKLQDR